ncbi:MAG: hypothetical protein QME81_09520 [bacterium]|nr:hypothetical protein [bacterium]
MPEKPDERKQWHPVLVDGLRYLLASHLRIDPEHGVAALPTRVDVMVLKRYPDQDLAFPYNHLGITTLVELESPGKWATWRVLCKTCVDHLLYRLTENLEQTANVNLWLLVSRASEAFFSLVQRELGVLKPLGSGLWRTVFMGSPLVVVHLEELSLSLETLPLLMVYQGPREREIAEFALKHAREHPLFMEQAIVFHARAMKEVLVMEGINVEAYRKLANVKDIIDLFGRRILIEEMGEDRLLEDLYREMGPERLLEFLDRKERERGK